MQAGRQKIEWRIEPGLVPYPEALAAMEARNRAICDQGAAELVWLLEHPPLYTAGTSAVADELTGLMDLPVFKAGRGGRYTYHGPGQRIAYVMLDLNHYGKDVRQFVWMLEEWLIQTLAQFRITGERRAGRVGVWVVDSGREAKIAALGVRLRRWVSLHGISLNVAPDLSHFAGIIPCGIQEFGVTSLNEMGIEVTMDEVDDALRATFEPLFGGPGLALPTIAARMPGLEEMNA